MTPAFNRFNLTCSRGQHQHLSVLIRAHSALCWITAGGTICDESSLMFQFERKIEYILCVLAAFFPPSSEPASAGLHQNGHLSVVLSFR